MSTKIHTKIVVILTAINFVSIILSGIFLQWLGLDTQYALPVAAALSALIFVFPLVIRFLRPFETLAQQFEKIDGGEPLEVGGNQFVAQICQYYNSLLQKRAASINELTRATNDLSFSASELSGVTESTNQNITRQQTETDMVATAMNEMSTTVEEVAHNASQAASAAENANQSAYKGETVAKASKSSIDALVGNVNEASDVIAQLEKQSTDITVVLDVIKGIAEQTNLLALNAAIEAARAGEQGRGFAVVADEVRSLATRTQESAREIDEMISALQAGARTSVSVMEAASEKGNESSEKVDETFNALKEIHQSVKTINDMNAQIATAAEEQSAVANEINQNIVSITQVAEETTRDANKSQETSVKIATISQSLQGLMKHFGTSADKSLDLSSAKAAHLNWKTRLRAFLDGKEALSLDEAVSHRHCNFGKWYYSDGLEHFGSLQGIIDVEQPHEEIHELIRMVIDLKNNGQIAEAEAAYKQVESISSEIVKHLDAAEQEAASL